jgi:predicted permease
VSADTVPPRFFDWLLRITLPAGPIGDSIRGDLLEELASATDPFRARLRFRLDALSLALRYGLRRPPRPRVKGTMERFSHELKYSVRSLVARPSFSLMVIATLALGIGANTAIFSLVHALVLRSLPVTDPDRLVVITRNQGSQVSQQFPLFQHYKAHSTTLDGVIAFRSANWRVSDAAGTERISGALVSGNYFSVLGVRPSIGTLIGEDDDTIPDGGGSRGAVAVLSHRYWTQQFGAQPRVIGQPIMLNARPFTIVGVTPAGFTGTEVGVEPDVFVPMMMVKTIIPGLASSLTQPRSNWIRIIGRLKPGVSVTQAEAELTTLLQAYNQEILRDPAVQKFDDSYRRNLTQQSASLVDGSAGLSNLRQRYSQPLTVLMAVMGLILLIACANVANLTLSRATARRQELAIRLGLGASRAQLIAQLLLESVILAGAGASAGLFLARVGRDVLLTYLPQEQSLSAPLDVNVLGFTVVLAIGAVLLFGLVPAWSSTRVDVAPVLRDGGAGRSPRVPFRKGLVVFQVSVSLVVVMGAVLFMRSLHTLLSIDTGFTRQNILVASVDVPPHRSMDTYRRLLAQLRTLPGVAAASTADAGPLGTGTGWTIYVPGYVPKVNEPRSTPWVGFISPEYFKTMMVPLLLGRDFDDRDLQTEAPMKLIVNETFARHYFGDENPVGRMVGLDRDKADVEIVGVVKDTKYTGLREERLRMVYVPYRPGPWGAGFAIHLRTTGDPRALASTLRQTVAAIEPSAPVYDIRTAEEQIGRSLLRERLVATVTTLFGGLALLLAAIGLYSVLSYGVLQRTKEFGVRIAVGADRRNILTLVLGEAAMVVGTGLAIGLLSAWALGRVVNSLLYGVTAGDALSAGIAVAVLCAAGALAAWIPARRASRLEPIRALRYE